MEKVLRSSKCFACFYGDSVSEKDFYIKNFTVKTSEKEAVFAFHLMRNLDYQLFEKSKNQFDTFSIEDGFLTKKVVLFLKENTSIRFFKLHIISKTTFVVRLAKIKIGEKRVVLSVF